MASANLEPRGVCKGEREFCSEAGSTWILGGEKPTDFCRFGSTMSIGDTGSKGDSVSD